MLIATVADLHLRGKDLEACRAQLEAMRVAIDERNIPIVFVAGDVFDNPQIGDKFASTGKIASVLVDFLDCLPATAFCVLHGQHDASGSEVVPTTRVLRPCPNVSLVEQVEAGPMIGLLQRSIRPVPPDGADMWFVAAPWEWAGDSLDAILDDHVRADILVGHCHVKGARLNGQAYAPHFHEPKPGVWDWSLSLDTLKRFRHVALGDFHCRQELVPGVGGYVGAFRQCNFGEEGNPTGFEVWDSETTETEWVELDAAPRHKTWTVDADYPAPTVEEMSGWLSRVIYAKGFDRVEAQHLAEAGAVVEREPDRSERIVRAAVDAADPRGMIRQWAATQIPPFEPERVKRMEGACDRIFGDKES